MEGAHKDRVIMSNNPKQTTMAKKLINNNPQLLSQPEAKMLAIERNQTSLSIKILLKNKPSPDSNTSQRDSSMMTKQEPLQRSIVLTNKLMNLDPSMVIANTLRASDMRRESTKIGKLAPIGVPKESSESLASIERTGSLDRKTPKHLLVRTNLPKRRKRSTQKAQGRSMLIEEVAVLGAEVAMKAREDLTKVIEKLATAETVAIMAREEHI